MINITIHKDKLNDLVDQISVNGHANRTHRDNTCAYLTGMLDITAKLCENLGNSWDYNIKSEYGLVSIKVSSYDLKLILQIVYQQILTLSKGREAFMKIKEE